MKKTTKEWFLNDARIGLYEVKKELPTDERKQLVDFYLKTCNKTISIEYAGGIVDEYLQSETVEVKEENNLLKKYMMHVLAYESADYVTEINTDFNKLTEHVPVLFTIEEKDELSAISAESHKELGYT